MSFTLWLHKRRLENFIFGVAFACGICAYSFWKPLGKVLKMTIEESYRLYFIGISLAFFFYSLAFWLCKYNKWHWFPMFVTLICFARVIQEMFFHEWATKYDLMEYINFLITFFLVFLSYLKKQYKKYNNEQRS